jgi:hypothetical protein
MLQRLAPICDAFRVSLHADDATLFINPSHSDLQATNFILIFFAEVNGLNANMAKTQFYPIHYGEIDLGLISEMGHILSNFSCTYLELPLNNRKPYSSSLQSLVEKIVKRLPGW